MSQSRKITYSVVILGLFVLVLFTVGPKNSRTSVSNVGNEEPYQDKDGNFWDSAKDYERYDDTQDYYVAPDGTVWENEYRYLESKR